MNKLNKKGFTLVELVIVIAVIAILAAVLIPTFSGAIEKANESAVLQAARSAYEEVLARDLADGVVDGKEGEKVYLSYKLAKHGAELAEVELGAGESKENANVSIRINQLGTNYELFEYTDSSKNLKATFDGTEWTVATLPSA